VCAGLDFDRFQQGAFFVTLTYHLQWGDHKQTKRQLQAFFKRLFRKWPTIGILWKLEPQERGAPHFHLIVWLWSAVYQAYSSEFRRWCQHAWSQVVGEGWNKHHRKHGCSVERVDNSQPGRLMRYLSKYVCKGWTSEQPTGRVWGIVGRIPAAVVCKIALMGFDDVVALTRRVRGWGKRSRYCGRITSNWRSYLLWGRGASMMQLLRCLGVVILPNSHTTYEISGQTIKQQDVPSRAGREPSSAVATARAMKQLSWIN
jgi:hypothetical protein